MSYATANLYLIKWKKRQISWMHIFGLFLSLNNYDSTIMMKSFPLILAIVLIAPSKAYCQIKGQQKNGPTSNTAVKISDELGQNGGSGL